MITKAHIKELIGKSNTTFAGIIYKTKVATAAKHRDINIEKVTRANVQVFGTVKDFDVYRNAVKRSATKLGNDQELIDTFTTADTYYSHSDVFSVVEHKTSGKEYLYAIYNHARSQYQINGTAATKGQVAEYLTPSAAKTLLSNGNTIHSSGLEHSVVVRTIALENILTFTANKETIMA